MWDMTELTVAAARARLADVVDEARERHCPVFLTRRGRRVAAVIDAEDLGRLDVLQGLGRRVIMPGSDVVLAEDSVRIIILAASSDRRDPVA